MPGVFVFGAEAAEAAVEGAPLPPLTAPPASLALREPVAAVSTGGRHALALTRSGHAYAWGWNALGQCGVDSDGAGTSVSQPTRVVAFEGLTAPGSPGAVRGVAAGGWHSVFLTTTGDVYTCGSGAHGQLGHTYPLTVRTHGDGDDPFAVVHPLGAIPPSLASGICAGLERAPRLLCAPALPLGGDGANNEEEVVAVGAGRKHSAAVTSRGRALVWGQACLPAPLPAPRPPGAGAWGVQRHTLQPAGVPLAAALAAAPQTGYSCGLELGAAAPPPTASGTPAVWCGGGWTAVVVEVVGPVHEGAGAGASGGVEEDEGHEAPPPHPRLLTDRCTPRALTTHPRPTDCAPHPSAPTRGPHVGRATSHRGACTRTQRAKRLQVQATAKQKKRT